MHTTVAIVGAGLSGLHAASLLTRGGVSCVVLEARSRAGGRILSAGVDVADGRPGSLVERYDLGPAWFWPDFQPRMKRLVEQFGMTAFAQHSEGATLVDRSRLEPPLRYERGFRQEPQSMRLQGGMQSLVDAITGSLPSVTIRLATQVNRITHKMGRPILIEALDKGASVQLTADWVILALPPRLAVERIEFVPELPRSPRTAMAAVPTWMAGQAKVLAVYEEPFWRQRGFSGAAISSLGPLAELHDASALHGRPALFGFVGLPPLVRRSTGPEKLKAAALAQLARLFGPEALRPVTTFAMDWADEPATSVAADWTPTDGHPAYGLPAGHDGIWEGRLILAGAETAEHHGGYLEGALEAAERAVEHLQIAARVSAS